jgi:hypothetical protein
VNIKMNVKAGLVAGNHNQTAAGSLKVKSKVKTGGTLNHNPAVAPGLKVKTGIKAGPDGTPIIRD